MLYIIQLSKEESEKLLDGRANTLKKVCLAKASNKSLLSRVAVVLDISSSMKKAFESGMVQAALERLLPIAMTFDDDGEMEFWTFNNEFQRYPPMTRGNFYNYIKDNKIQAGGGTSYCPVLQDVCKYFICEKPADVPTYVIFITDGDNNDHKLTDKIIRAASYLPVYFQFIGVGDAQYTEFKYLGRLEKLRRRYVNNANFFTVKSLSDIKLISDEELYSKLMNEYTLWLDDPKVKEMLGALDGREKTKRIKALYADYTPDRVKYDNYIKAKNEKREEREEFYRQIRENLEKCSSVDD